MFGTSLRLLSRDSDAEDAVQEAFIASWRRLPEFRSDAKFSTWLYRIVTNRSLNELRRRKPVAVLEPDGRLAGAAEFLIDTNSPDRQVRTLRHDGGTCGSLLPSLPEPLRVCWLLREVDHRSYQEIADIVGVPEPTVRGRISRARANLAEAMTAWR